MKNCLVNSIIFSKLSY